jgi:hypothetical protein
MANPPNLRMANPPNLRLSATSASVLRIIKEKGVVRGSELLREVKSLDPTPEPDAILQAVRELANLDLISLSGDLGSPNTLSKAYFNFNPSWTSYADLAIRSAYLD